jgi:Kef-type K+ transport system membrane component KefB
MAEHSIVFSIFLIFTGAALLATLALYARQAMIVAYIVLGALLGPSGAGLVDDAALIEDIAHVGIIFLLFLLGLNLLPQKLLQLLRETTLVTIASTTLFGALGFAVAWLVGLPLFDSVVVALATTFSSTIIGLKLLPTTVLHHRHTGEVIISVLLLQDLIAIVALLVLHGLAQGGVPVLRIGLLLVALPVLTGVAWLLERYVLNRLFLRFDRIQEYLFLLSIGWCLGLAQAADSLGLSYEIGAFIAGITIATSPIARHIAESLKPLRDFFLVMFFFALGAGFDWIAVERMLLPAAALAVLVMALKPIVFRLLFVGAAESDRLAWETGVRLGQMSEFSLLLVFVALEAQLVGEEAASLVQVATVLTFIASTYLIVLRYPTPIAISDRLRRD